MSSNFGQIGPPTTAELAALERLRNTSIDLIMGKMVFPLFMPRHQKQYAYLQTILKTPVKFQKDWPKTVGGVADTRMVVGADGRTSVRQRPPPFLYRQLLLQF